MFSFEQETVQGTSTTLQIYRKQYELEKTNKDVGT